jgi:hypothetical protein
MGRPTAAEIQQAIAEVCQVGLIAPNGLVIDEALTKSLRCFPPEVSIYRYFR